MYKKLITVVGLFCLLIGILAAENPEAVSPGSDLRASVVNQVCPTFSWAQVPGVTAYQIAVFEMSERFEGLSYYENLAALGQPVLIKKISGSALSWTPSLEQALQNGGRYVWFVQAQDAYGTGAWSVGKKFAVRVSLGLTEIKEKVRQQLEAKGVKGDLVDEAFEGIGSQDEKTKIGGELKGKIQSGVREEAQKKVEAQGNKEIKSKENQAVLGTGDFTAGALGSEGDAQGNVYYGTGTDNSLPGTAYNNSFFGCLAGYSNSDGDYNTFTGYSAGYLNTSGDYNTFVGYYTGRTNTTGSYNTFIGYSAGRDNTTGEKNTFLGYSAGRTNTTGNYNTFMGYYSGLSNTTGYGNTFIGYAAGNYNTEGNYSTFMGYYSGLFNTTGERNTFIGYSAGYHNTTGYYNTFLGYYAGYFNATGYSNVFLGYRAGYSETGSNKLYIENSNTSSPLIYGEFDNNLIKINGDFKVTGYLSLDNGTTQIGSAELNLLDGKTLVTGGSADNDKLVTKGYVDYYDDVGGGLTGGAMTDQYVCKWDDTGTQLVDSLIYENEGAVNIDGQLFINDGNYLGLTGNTSQLTVDTTSTRARFKLQADGGGTNTDDYFNFTMRNDYGDVTLSVRDSSAGVWLPMLSYEYLNSKVDFKDNDIVTTGTISSGGGAYTSGGAWIEASSRDYKENIVELGQSESIRALASLNPVRYNYKNKKDEEFLGFIAEDVPDLVAMNGRRGMRAMDIVAVLTKVVQDQQRVNEEQNKLINKLIKRIEELEHK